MWLTPTLKFITWLLLAYLGVGPRHLIVEHTHKNQSFLFLNIKNVKNSNLKNLEGLKLYQNLAPEGPSFSPRSQTSLTSGLCSGAFVTWDSVPVTTQE